MILSRRQFIQTGLAGSCLLALAGWLNAAGARRFSDDEREMHSALSNTMLEGALPSDAEQRRQLVALTVDGIAVVVAGLSLAAQKEVGELFGLLVLAPGRRLLAGVGKPWREASLADISEFLQAWRASRLNLLQSAYGALHDLIFGAWYARSDTWEGIGYPGPPRGVL
jgi:hypothetical protein